MKLFVVLLAIIANVCGAPKPAGRNGLASLLAEHGGLIPTGPGRIIGGSAAVYGQIPYIITMQYFGFHRCGGAIITSTRILTAAHCTEGVTATTFSVRAGSLLSQSDGQLIGVQSVYEHPSYNTYTLDYDIAVMQLVSSLDFSPNGVAAIGMPVQGAAVAYGTTATVSGWGTTSEGGSASPFKQYVTVPVISNAECNDAYGGDITDRMICAGVPEGGRDACQGDSGGPLTAGNVLVGIVSWGYGCARPNYPGVYARVASVRSWIDSV